MVKDVLLQRGQHADCYACDVTSMEEVKHVFGQLFQQEDIHMLINNAGSGIFGPLEKFTEEEVNLCWISM